MNSVKATFREMVTIPVKQMPVATLTFLFAKLFNPVQSKGTEPGTLTRADYFLLN